MVYKGYWLLVYRFMSLLIESKVNLYPDNPSKFIIPSSFPCPD